MMLLGSKFDRNGVRLGLNASFNHHADVVELVDTLS